jgi:hypothetical protein
MVRLDDMTGGRAYAQWHNVEVRDGLRILLCSQPAEGKKDGVARFFFFFTAREASCGAELVEGAKAEMYSSVRRLKRR